MEVKEEWGGHQGVAAVSLLHGHFFSKSFLINFYDFFEFFSSKHHGERGRVEWPAGGGCSLPFS
jgi:hypothetical protein